jgi:hypothetical protein
MAGRKYGVVVFARTPPAYAAMSAAEQAKPGKAFEATLKKYAGKVDLVRRYWTGTFTHEASDVFVMECDDPAVMHEFNEELNKAMAKGGGDPARFGSTVHVSFGLNPDADQPRGRGRR